MNKEKLIEELDECVKDIIQTLKSRGIEVTHESVMSFYDTDDYFQHIYGPSGQYVMEEILNKVKGNG